MSKLTPDESEKIKEEQRLRTTEALKTVSKINLKFVLIFLGIFFGCICLLSIIYGLYGVFSRYTSTKQTLPVKATQADRVATQVGNLLATKQVLESQIAQATAESTSYIWAYPFNESLSTTITASTPGVTQQPINSSQTPRSNKLIGIVAGYSGNDSGAVCPEALGGYHEVDINQKIANFVKDNLVAAGYDVDLLTEFDTRLTGYQSLALVSIHSDSCEYINDQATGFKVSTTGLNMNPEKSARLTTCLQTKYTEITGLQFHSGAVTSDMTTYHPFNEVDNNTTAAVIEIGYLYLDNKILTEHPDLIARGISEGILCYVNNENKSP